MKSKSAVFSHWFSDWDRMGSKLQFETTVLKTSKRCKTFDTNRILISHPVQAVWGFENGENIWPNLEYESHIYHPTGWSLTRYFALTWKWSLVREIARWHAWTGKWILYPMCRQCDTILLWGTMPNFVILYGSPHDPRLLRHFELAFLLLEETGCFRGFHGSLFCGKLPNSSCDIARYFSKMFVARFVRRKFHRSSRCGRVFPSYQRKTRCFRRFSLPFLIIQPT